MLQGALLALTAILACGFIYHQATGGGVSIAAGTNVTAVTNGTVVTISAAGGTNTALSAITAATAANTITNGNLVQTWKWQTSNDYWGLQLIGLAGSPLATAGVLKLDTEANATNYTAPLWVGTRGTMTVMGSWFTNQLLCATNTAGVPVLADIGRTNNGVFFTEQGPAMASGGVEQVRATTNGIVGRNYLSPYVTLAYTGSTNVLVDVQAGNAFKLTVTNTAYLIFTNFPSAWTSNLWTAALHILQDGTGHAVTFNTSYAAFADGGTAPTLSSAANARDTLSLWSGPFGTNVHVNAGVNYQ